MKTQFAGSRAFSMLALAVVATAAQAQFSGPPPTTFSGAPFTQLSNVNSGASLLTLSNTPADITVAGKFLVTLPATPVAGPAIAGTLVHWTVDWPLSLNQTLTNFVTQTLLDGFSQPPAGVLGTTYGTVRTYIADTNTNAVIGNSLSVIQLALPLGSASWFAPPLINISAPFTVNIPATGNYALRQVFDLDGIYFSGPGGIWTVDVPVLSSLTAVPEIPVWQMFSLAGVWWLWRRRR